MSNLDIAKQYADKMRSMTKVGGYWLSDQLFDPQALSRSERRQLEKYLQRDWNIQKQGNGAVLTRKK